MIDRKLNELNNIIEEFEDLRKSFRGHQFVLVPPVSSVWFPVRLVSLGVVFPPHVAFPVGVPVGRQVTACEVSGL